MVVAEIYTDGACRGNPGLGGYGTVILTQDNRANIMQGYKLTTNNRMELMAVIAGLEHANEADDLRIYTDSQYIANAFNKGWINNWRLNNFRKSDGKPVKNPDLWERLLNLLDGKQYTFMWVKGHAGNKYNEVCDKLATRAADFGPYKEDTYYVQNEI